MSALTLEHIVVGDAVVDVLVRVTNPTLASTSAVPGLADEALELLPGLRRHSCENGTAHGVAAELADTQTPHLLEHIAFELMALSGSPRTLRGETRWDFSEDGVGVYRVRLAYDHDLVVLGALKEGLGIVEWLLASAGPTSGNAKVPRPDVGAIVESLRALRPSC